MTKNPILPCLRSPSFLLLLFLLSISFFFSLIISTGVKLVSHKKNSLPFLIYRSKLLPGVLFLFPCTKLSSFTVKEEEGFLFSSEFGVFSISLFHVIALWLTLLFYMKTMLL